MSADFLDLFWGATGFFNIMMQQFYVLFAAAFCFIKYRPCDVIDAKNDLHGVIKDS